MRKFAASAIVWGVNIFLLVGIVMLTPLIILVALVDWAFRQEDPRPYGDLWP